MYNVYCHICCQCHKQSHPKKPNLTKNLSYLRQYAIQPNGKPFGPDDGIMVRWYNDQRIGGAFFFGTFSFFLNTSLPCRNQPIIFYISFRPNSWCIAIDRLYFCYNASTQVTVYGQCFFFKKSRQPRFWTGVT